MNLPAGSSPPPRDDLDDVEMVHAMDGDGSSLCETVAKGVLVPVDHYAFADVPGTKRCVLCESMLRL